MLGDGGKGTYFNVLEKEENRYCLLFKVFFLVAMLGDWGKGGTEKNSRNRWNVLNI